MNKPYPTYQLLLAIFLSLIIGNAPLEAAVSSERATGHELLNVPRDFLKRRIESAELSVSFFSYKPKLEQFTTLLNGLGSPGIDVALMPVISIALTLMPELSSRLEMGYWTNSTEIPPPTVAGLSATFIPISLNLIYRPILLREFIPLYLGGGAGYSHLSVSGSALDVLKQQGVTVDEGNSGLTGYALIGLEYLFLDNQLAITLEAKRVLKTFTTSGMPPLDLNFDGTAIGMGIGFRF